MTVLVAREGEHALSIIERVLPDVILMDAVMPGTDGFETCRRLKQNKALAHVPVIFMTGLSDTEHIIEGLEAGGVDYVTKPLVPGELLARIRVHLANARIAQSARTALDAFGRFLLAVDGTRQGAVVHAAGGEAAWNRVQRFRHRRIRRSAQTSRTGCSNARRRPPPRRRRRSSSRPMRSSPKLQLLYVGQIGPDENLLR